MKPPRATSGWLTGIALAAVVAVNLAGLWGIRVARQGALDEARRAFALDVSAKATAIEARLSEVRSDLAFLGASPGIARLEEAARQPGTASLLHATAESALLLFLRSHVVVVRVGVRSSSGRPLVHVGRRGGVPVLWAAATPTGDEGAAVDPRRPRLIALLPERETTSLAGGVTIETEVEPASLLGSGEPGAEGPRRCELRDAGQRVLGRFPSGPRPDPSSGEREVHAQASLRADAWSAPGPFTLSCAQPERSVLGLAEPVWSRYRTTSTLNLAVMGLAMLLGAFTVQQARRRAGLEARAAEQARVRELERQLFHAERLTTVGRLAAGIAHEINNPLEGMANYLSLARDALGAKNLEAAERHLGSVKQGLERAAGIVRHVLAQADQTKAPKTPLDLNQVLRETAQFVRSRKEFAHVSFDLDLADGLVVEANAVMLGQVAMNLMVNACEAQPGGGELRVATLRRGREIVTEFADRGPGVPEADRQRVFEPFFSTKNSTGLGLSICHTIVRQHGGELDVVARAGGGSVFRMRLPAREA